MSDIVPVTKVVLIISVTKLLNTIIPKQVLTKKHIVYLFYFWYYIEEYKQKEMLMDTEWELYRDYLYIDEVTVTEALLKNKISFIRKEMEDGSEEKRLCIMARPKLQEGASTKTLHDSAFVLTNALNVVGGLLSRAYAIKREMDVLYEEVDLKYSVLTNNDMAYDVVKGTKDKVSAQLATKYQCVYTCRKMLNDFTQMELQDYIMELNIMKDVLSRQVSAMEVEYRLAGLF